MIGSPLIRVSTWKKYHNIINKDFKKNVKVKPSLHILLRKEF
jgi:hypothetical protein